MNGVRIGCVLAIAGALSCSKYEASRAPAEQEAPMLAAKSELAPAAPPPGAEGKFGKKKESMRDRRMSAATGGAGRAEMDEGGVGGLGGADKMAAIVSNDGSVEEEEAAPATRSWFPESFLFDPRVVTDATGRASVDVKVPDRLTTWRVLALAHTRGGEQAGAVTKFLGTLPVYVEPVVPRQLIAGDVVRVPVQLVNTTEATLSRRLDLSIEGGALEGARSREARVPGGGSAVETVVVSARQPGEIALTATLMGADSIRRTIAVIPRGTRVVVERSGTLAAPRERMIAAPQGEFSSVELEVFPGALAVVRSELATAGQRGLAADVAYALLLAGEAPALLAKLGGEPDLEALRALRVVATQRAMRHARVASLETATMLAEAAFAHPDQPVLARLGERLSAQLAGWQRPDGTFGGATGWTLQRLLVGTAESVHAAAAEARALGATTDVDPARLARARSRAEATRIRASAAVERNLGRVEDPYTAAVLIASGAAQGRVAELLRAKVRAAVKAGEDGARTLEIGPGVVRADGLVPGAVEAAAVAALALAGDPEAPWVPDLAATVLAGYVPGYGFGDGRASLWSLRAVIASFAAPLPEAVEIVLELDGQQLSSGRFDARQLRDVLRLDARVPEAAGERRWGVRATPPVPGLGYRLALTTWVPVTPEPEAGVGLLIKTGGQPKVGRAVDITLIASAPAGYSIEVVHRLPAGVVPDRPSLDALVTAGTLSSYDTEDGAVRLQLPALEVATPWQGTYRVVPTLAGALQGGASTIAVAGETRTIPGGTWAISP